MSEWSATLYSGDGWRVTCGGITWAPTESAKRVWDRLVGLPDIPVTCRARSRRGCCGKPAKLEWRTANRMETREVSVVKRRTDGARPLSWLAQVERCLEDGEDVPTTETVVMRDSELGGPWESGAQLPDGRLAWARPCPTCHGAGFVMRDPGRVFLDAMSKPDSVPWLRDALAVFADRLNEEGHEAGVFLSMWLAGGSEMLARAQPMIEEAYA